MDNKKGFAPIIILFIVVIAAIGIFILSKKGKSGIEIAMPSPLSTITVSPNPSLTSTPVVKKILPTVMSTSTPFISPTAMPTTVPNIPSPTSAPPTPTPTPTPFKATCSINADVTQGNSPLTVNFTYNASTGPASNSVTAEQWDFDGDGNWDTDMSAANGHVSHVYQSGAYTVNLRLQISDGSITDVCSKHIIAN